MRSKAEMLMAILRYFPVGGTVQTTRFDCLGCLDVSIFFFYCLFIYSGTGNSIASKGYLKPVVRSLIGIDLNLRYAYI